MSFQSDFLYSVEHKRRETCFFPYNRSQQAPMLYVYQHSSNFCVLQKKSMFWKDMSVSRWQNIHFWVNYPFNIVQKHLSFHRIPQIVQYNQHREWMQKSKNAFSVVPWRGFRNGGYLAIVLRSEWNSTHSLISHSNDWVSLGMWPHSRRCQGCRYIPRFY